MKLRSASSQLLASIAFWIAVGSAFAQDLKMGNAWEDPRNPIRVLFGGERLELWSLQPVGRPAIPPPKEEASNPIDAFLDAAWRDRGIEGAPLMNRADWIQRATLDLTGLRATREEVELFVQDPAPDAWERVIDRLLASPAYGEHTARQWLDVVRYSDSNGFDWDEFRKTAWRYRDWVVRAQNSDIPFDQFITMQLAGDELLEGPPRDQQEQDCLIATGYLRLGPFDHAAKLFNEQDRARVEVLTDLTETTASALLGLTMSCCRCHDHKTDPLSQADHYRLRAFFAATRFSDDQPIDTVQSQQSRELHNLQIQKQIDELLKKIDELRVRAKQLKQVDTSDAQEVNDAKWKELLGGEERDRWQEWEREVAVLQGHLLQPETGLVMTDDPEAIDPIHVLHQGDHRSRREKVEPGFPSVLWPEAPQMAPVRSGKSTGRRLTLAHWICSTDNPWTSRVAVNRAWQHFFGQGLVATPNDFGITGSPPTHPELLDHLATQLIDRGWSMKSIHRQIALSQAYRRQPIPGGQLVDSEGSSRWGSMRTNLRRLNADQFRDAILQVTGLLQYRAGGPPVWPPLSDEILQANPAVLDDNETKTKGWYPSPKEDQSVRSIYLVQKRGMKLPWMETFDQPDTSVSCPKRETSIVASQALSLMNGDLTWQGAKALSESLSQRLRHEHDRKSATEALENERFIVALFQQVLSREPSEEEMERCSSFLQQRSGAALVLVLLNSNEFAFVP
ncbi:MAG: DUF1549 and DUF1553 domain-containing protein [Pirellulaceae bacterium]